MLVELSIRNLAVIEQVHVKFESGFTVLTGETGAGKSIIIDAMSLIVGGRGSSDLVRHGAAKADIEAMFDMPLSHPVWAVLDRLGIDVDPDEAVIIRREISAQGKSSGRINGHLVNLSMLKEIGEYLVNIHGQHEHQSLLKADLHLQWLDLYGQELIYPIKQAYEKAYTEYTTLKQQLKQLQEQGQQALQMQDLYRFQIEEISAAKLSAGEEERTLEERKKLANAEKLMQASSEAYDALYGTHKALELVSTAQDRIEHIADWDSDVLKPILEQIQNAYYQLEDAAFLLRDYRDQIEFNPERLQDIEERLDLISGLKRKYAPSTELILEYLQNIVSEMDSFERQDELITKLQQQLDVCTKQLNELAVQLSQARQKIGKQLSDEIMVELRDLQMERTVFKVEISQITQAEGEFKYTEDGIDHVEFMISANPGEPLRPLQKVASGGELSRIMLAMKSILAKVDDIPVLIFDEVDTGVSGRAAQAIAEKLHLISSGCQVFSITHLPQVACMADSQYYIRKQVEKDRTFTMVDKLDQEGRELELARLLGGVEVTATTRQHAVEMLNMAQEKKNTLIS